MATDRDQLIEQAARVIDPDVWAVEVSSQGTVGAQWRVKEGRRISLAAAERLYDDGLLYDDDDQLTELLENEDDLHREVDRLTNLCREMEAARGTAEMERDALQARIDAALAACDGGSEFGLTKPGAPHAVRAALLGDQPAEEVDRG